MPIVMAGQIHRVPRVSVSLLVILALAILGGCGTKQADYPWAKNTGTLKTSDNTSLAQVQSAAEPVLASASESAEPAPAPSATPTSEPAAPFLPEPAGTKTQTSNGGDLIAPPTIVVEEPKRSPIQFTLNGAYMYGSVNGYVQMPRAGVVGTTNANRPHLDSIGISFANIGDGELAAHWGQHSEAFLGAQITHLSGSSFLGVDPLTTDGVTFPAGSHVSSSVKLDWYRLGYRYEIPINTADNGIPDLTFTPWVSLVVLDFGYHLTAPKVDAASRNFTKPGAQIGATFAWRPGGGPISFEAELGGFPTMNTLPTMSIESLYARYHFYQYRRFDFTGLVGIAWEQQAYRDNKPSPNDISANFGPMLLVGLGVKY